MEERTLVRKQLELQKIATGYYFDSIDEIADGYCGHYNDREAFDDIEQLFMAEMVIKSTLNRMISRLSGMTTDPDTPQEASE